MKSEASFLLQKAGIANALEIMDQVREESIRGVERHKHSASYVDYYANLMDLTLINKMRDEYRLELDMFDYPLSPFITVVS